MRFVWDEDKRQENIDKHGIDFLDVPRVFDGPMLCRIDDRTDYGEDRWLGLGMLDVGVALVVYTEPDDEVVRIISARKANRLERNKYQQGFPH